MNEKQIGLFDEADRKLAERFRVEKPNPVDTAKDMKKAMEEYGLTQEELAARIGKSRSAVANTLRLLTLSPEVIRRACENARHPPAKRSGSRGDARFKKAFKRSRNGKTG